MAPSAGNGLVSIPALSFMSVAAKVSSRSVSDTTSTRWGRFRPFLLFGSVPLLALGVAIFSVPGFGPGGRLAYAYVTYALFGLAYSLVNIPYGSLGTVIVLLTWIYLSAYALIFGAELNSEIEHQTAKDSTTGKPKPMGDRGAWAADNVATDDTIQDRPEEQREGEKLSDAAPAVAQEKG